jgi:uncharacterized iron-regulated membrane protein
MSRSSKQAAAPSAARRPWLDYVSVWRWHFYAGLFCMPFFCWLAITGSVYLFRPDIEAILDRPYESLTLDGARAAPSSEARAALAALPGSVFDHYEPPATPGGAAQVVLRRDGALVRVYVHPRTLQPMKTIRDDDRIMDVVSHLHGELLLGTRGSMLVELAGSWGVIMILSGLYLWLPRDRWRLAGLVYPRWGQRGRGLWRDLHAVAGLWISLVTLFLLLSGLPWSANWGNYLTWARNHWAATRGAPDWTIGGEAPGPQRSATSASGDAAADGMAAMPGMSAAEMAAMAPQPGATHGVASQGAGQDLQPLDRLVPLAARLQLARPVWIAAPAAGARDWSIASHAQNRPERITYSVQPATAAISAVQGFSDQNIVDRVVNVSVAAHEGQLFGRINQAILLLNAIGVVLITVSGVVMWWRRRPARSLGAPPLPARFPGRPGAPASLIAVVLLLALLLPLFGASLLLVLAIERTLLRGWPSARRWLGLAPSRGS